MVVVIKREVKRWVKSLKFEIIPITTSHTRHIKGGLKVKFVQPTAIIRNFRSDTLWIILTLRRSVGQFFTGRAFLRSRRSSARFAFLLSHPRNFSFIWLYTWQSEQIYVKQWAGVAASCQIPCDPHRSAYGWWDDPKQEEKSADP